jgi:cell division topological specificity factor
VSIFSFFRPKKTAPAARERLQLLLAHERVAGSDNRLVAILQEEILAVIARHMQIDRDKVRVKLGRDDEVNTLEIDIEMPVRTPGRFAARA